MSLTNNQLIELFDVWGIDFMGHFPVSYGNVYVLVVGYASKWVKAVATRTCGVNVMFDFLKKNIFSRFVTPTTIISDGGSHFCNTAFRTFLKRYGIKHKIATAYHPQTSGQV